MCNIINNFINCDVYTKKETEEEREREEKEKVNKS